MFFGQLFSLENSYKVGMLPNNESGLLVEDQSNAPGYSTVRHPAVRIVKDLGPIFSAGVALENPQTSFTGASAVSTTTITNSATLNATTTSSLEKYPDIVAKIAADTSFGHYEVSGMGRFLQSYTNGASSSSSHTRPAGGIHLGTNITVIPGKLEFRGEGLAGYGVAHYDSAGFTDAFVNTAGTVQPIPFISTILGLIYHPIPTNDLYTYFGYAQVDHTSSQNGTPGFGSFAGGTLAAATGCMHTNSGVCTATVHRDWDATIGDWQRFYQGPAGTMFAGAMFAFYRDDAFKSQVGTANATPHAINQKIEFDIRYSPFQ
jgi:hypothetical protein